MDNLQRELQANLRRLSENQYPGRGIILGRAENGRLLQFYWIMGRSENSRNRIFESDGGDLRTKPLAPEKLSDPSLVIYRAMGEAAGQYLVSNGDHTETLLEVIGAGGDSTRALRRHMHEPDEPHFTPRIAGGLALADGLPRGWLAIIKSDPFNKGQSQRFLFEYPELSAGMGWCISTYNGDGTPLPSFSGEPFPVPLPGEEEELMMWIWHRLNERNRVSLALKIIDEEKGRAEIRVVNQYKS